MQHSRKSEKNKLPETLKDLSLNKLCSPKLLLSNSHSLLFEINYILNTVFM